MQISERGGDPSEKSSRTKQIYRFREEPRYFNRISPNPVTDRNLDVRIRYNEHQFEEKNMKNVTLFALGWLIIIGCIAVGQGTSVQAGGDSAVIAIQSIEAKKFPTLEVIMKVMSRRGTPIWDLQKDQVTVKEKGEDCEISSFASLSKDKPINLSLVVDNSGSMNVDKEGYLRYVFGKSSRYVTPLENAQQALLKFIDSFDSGKDSILIVGFSDTVSKNHSFTADKSTLKASIDAMYAYGVTAFYDAVYYAVESAASRTGMKAVVALTDGDDNSSLHSLKDVIGLAKSEKIPVYVVGLGEITTAPLKRMANSTGGVYKYTKNAGSLSMIYEQLKKQIQATYRLEYIANEGESEDSLRTYAISFDNGSLDVPLIQTEIQIELPKSFLADLRSSESTEKALWYGGGGTVVGGGALWLLLLWKRRKRQDDEAKATV